MVRFMKKSTINLTTLVRGSTRFFGMMLSVALLVPAEAMSQVVYSNPPTVNLLTAGNFIVLGGSAVTVGVGTAVTGDVGVYPTATLTNNGTVNGTIHIADGTASQAQSDLTAAYGDAAGRSADATVPTELGGTTLGRGVYTSAAGTFGITGTLTLTGTATDIFIFQMATTLTTGASSNVTLIGGALASNVFWQVGSSATIDGNFKGNILAFTSITQNSGASILNGKALARNGAVTVDGNSVMPIGAVAGTDTTTTWRMQLTASIGTAQDNENYAGVADSATDGLDPSFDTPEAPPAPGNYVSLYFPHHEWGSTLGDNFASDIKKNRALADTVKRWYFQVQSNVLNDTVTLSFINDRIPSAFGKYLTDLNSGVRINIKNLPLYKYYNTSGTAHSFMMIIGDSTPPSLTLTTPNGSNIWRSGTSKNIVWSTTDGTGIDSIFVYSSSNGGSSYSAAVSLGYAQSTHWTVPNEYLNNNYSIKVLSRDSLGNQTVEGSANTFTVVGDSLATNGSNGWTLVSLPLQSSDSTARAILGDDFTNSPYYLWSYDQSNGYVTPTFLQFGHGYWLGTTSASPWDVRGAAVEMDSTVTDIPAGYVIVGSNYVRNVPTQNMSFRKSGVNYSFSDAVAQGILVNAVYGYDGSSYQAINALQMFKGYWLGILQSGVQMIQKPAVSSATPLMKITQPTQFMWDLSIIASSSKQTDQFAKIGVRADATDDFDVLYDIPQPPRSPGNSYMELYTVHSGEHYPAILGSKYAHDYRGTKNPQWSFILETSDSGQVNLQWDNTFLSQLSNSVQLMLTDAATLRSIDMTKQNSYAFTYSAPRYFTIASSISGSELQGILPSSYALSQNYPNPFNPTTTIQFAIPQPGSVTLTIFDVLGREIASLADGFRNAGIYSVTWNATNVASGIYFYRLNAGTFTATKKLILLR